MLIDCHNCKAKVNAELIAEYDDEDFFATKTFLLKCPSCDKALVAESSQDFVNEQMKWTRPIRVYPRPKRDLDGDIPETVRASIEEAERCMLAGAHLAAVAMCGRALEAICRHYGTSGSYLGDGLQDLKAKGVIDSRLLDWGEELREQRNAAAHATEETFLARDANDVMAFTYAIIDYVFLLAKKFDEFMERKEGRLQKKKKVAKKP